MAFFLKNAFLYRLKTCDFSFVKTFIAFETIAALFQNGLFFAFNRQVFLACSNLKYEKTIIYLGAFAAEFDGGRSATETLEQNTRTPQTLHRVAIIWHTIIVFSKKYLFILIS